jgi:predicted esterase YcpF (UPF0227 family)
MKRILYLHGIGSTGGGNTVNSIKEAFPDIIVDSPELPTMPKDAFEYINDLVNRNKYDIVIGTSLGGFYAMMISGVKKILVNPAMFASEDIPKAIGFGTHPYLRERISGEKTYTVDETYIKELATLQNRFFSNWLDNEYIFETTAIFGTEDTLFSHINDYKALYKSHNMYTANFGHRIDSETFDNVLKPIIANHMSENVDIRGLVE